VGGGRVGSLRKLTEALAPQATEGLRRFLAERPIGIGVRTKRAAGSILENGRFRSQFETGNSTGFYSPGMRARREEDLLGLSRDLPPEQRPIYGALRSADRNELAWSHGNGLPPWVDPIVYGDTVFLLRPEAKARSTYTLGDSLGRDGRALSFGEVPPAEVVLGVEPTYGRDLREGREVPRLERAAERAAASPSGYSVAFSAPDYVETQTRGPVGVEDVSALLMPRNYSPRLFDMARDRGIPVHAHEDLERDAGLLRHLGLRAAGAGVGAGAAAEGLIGGEDEPPRYQDGGRVGLIERGLAAAIRAYHGSPHRFDRFDISKIGTGEGNTTYGHGLYFAESEDVARGYRDRLSSWPAAARDLARETIGRELSDDAARDVLQVRARGEAPDRGAFRLWARTPELRDIPREQLAELMRRAADMERPGAMYEVDLHVDPDRLLDWDRPLSEQHRRVEEAVADLAAEQRLRLGNVTGARAYGDVARARGREVMLGPPDDPARQYPVRGSDEPAASAALLERGIPGIRYLDGNSRGRGQGTSNFVLFSDEPVEIVRRYARGGLAAGFQQPEGGKTNNIPGPADELATTQGATERGTLQAAALWEAAGSALRGGLSQVMP
jgi:hypothetical protein